MSANPNGIRTPRAELYEQVKELRDQGLIYREISERLGLSISTVQEVYTDPTGAGARARKEAYYGTCVDCGARTSYRSGGVSERCQACDRERAGTIDARRAQSQRLRGRTRYADDHIRAVLWSMAVDGRVSKDRYDAAYQAAPRGFFPASCTLVFRFGSWRKAIEWAGLQVSNDGYPARRADSITDEDILRGIRRCADEVGHWPKYAEYGSWARREGAPVRNILAQRFGSYWAAVEAAMARVEDES